MPTTETARECRVCGCTETTPCMDAFGPCAWADRTYTLCSNCAEIGVMVAQWLCYREPPPDVRAPLARLADLAAEIYAAATPEPLIVEAGAGDVSRLVGGAR
jgi:hypothetical protein